MLKIVVDTNVLISAFITQGNEYEILELARLGKIELIISPEILEEFNIVISREKFSYLT
ncbi:MAG: putative toxin-antitoxin system toxin component, PIN family [Nanoarchaeota archaeon]|nr:putative toxin-antitoxin system toxin component, PIN family [Nanoarchaeota archaeon]